MLEVNDIKGFSLFTGLDDKELGAIAALGTRKEFPVNSVIFTPDTPATDVYILEEGNDSIQMEIPVKYLGPNIVIHTLCKGETFGWAPLCPPHASSAIARVILPATVIVIDGPGLKLLLAQDKHMGHIIMKNLSAIISSRLSYITTAFTHEILRLREKNSVPA